MTRKHSLADEQRDLNKLLDFLRQHPRRSFEEGQLKLETGVSKSLIRDVLRDHPRIDASELEAGKVCYMPSEGEATQLRSVSDRDRSAETPLALLTEEGVTSDG